MKQAIDEKDRAADIAWIQENMHLFWPTAQEQYQTHGRGALVVDTTVRPTGAGHPTYYYPQAMVEEVGHNNATRMVRTYDPQTEIVFMLMKSEGFSVYQVRV